MPLTIPTTKAFDDTSSFSFRRMRKGAARKLLLAGALLMSFALATSWSTELSGGGVTTTAYIGGGTTQSTTSSGGKAGGGSGFDRGVARYPMLLIIATLAWAAWRGASDRRQLRYVPLAAVLLLGLWDRGQLQTAKREAAEWDARLNSTTVVAAGGPALFMLFLVPFALGAVLLARAPYPWRAGAAPAPSRE